jgi:hypothetical protein
MEARKSINDFKFLCHGIRNGTEVLAFQHLIESKKVFFLGTDLNPWVNDFKFGLQHDFQKRIPKQFGKFNVIYTNSLDQAQYPKKALEAMYQDLLIGGVLIISLNEYSGKMGYSDLDPFSCEIEFFPYIYLNWFSRESKISFIKDHRYARRGWIIIRKC